jgi:hypothetical protein
MNMNDLGGWFTQGSVGGGWGANATGDYFMGGSPDGNVHGGGVTVGAGLGATGSSMLTYNFGPMFGRPKMLIDNSWQKRMRLILLGIWCVAVACLISGISFFYWPDVTIVPMPGTGRIYPISNHGWTVYLTKGEWVARRVLLASAFTLILLFIVIIGYLSNKAKAGPSHLAIKQSDQPLGNNIARCFGYNWKP